MVAAFVLAGMAAASIPDSNGVIHGCFNNAKGGLRVIDSAVETCKPNETALNWSQTGPPGVFTGDPGSMGLHQFDAPFYLTVTCLP